MTTVAGVPLALERSGLGTACVVQRDAVPAAQAFLDQGERPKLIYIDPPFAADREFIARPPSGAPRLAYADKWPSLQAYVAFMRDVIAAAHALLDPEGSFLLHCDHHAAPYLAIVCDEIFGTGDRVQRNSPGFRNELIWSYGLGGSSPRCYPKKHDTILWYTKGKQWYFEPPRVPATSNRMAGQTKKAPDVLQVPTLNNMAKERIGYPTQKPLALLSMLVEAHTQPGDLVVDLFSGSGTTAVAATRAGRKAWVADPGIDAIAATTARLLEDGCSVRVFADESALTDRLNQWRR